MKSLLLVLALFAGQAVTMQSKPVVHLKPNTNLIQPGLAGSLVALIRTPTSIYLPSPPPQSDAKGLQWAVDVKNFGPLPVTVLGKGGFSVPIAVNQAVQIYSDGSRYFLKY